MFLSLFNRRRSTTPAPSTPRCACDALEDLPLFSPLVTELLALHTHTRALVWLSQREVAADEFRLAAHSVLTQLLKAWEHQTGGRGSIDDLLVKPSATPSTARERRPGASTRTPW